MLYNNIASLLTDLESAGVSAGAQPLITSGVVSAPSLSANKALAADGGELDMGTGDPLGLRLHVELAESSSEFSLRLFVVIGEHCSMGTGLSLAPPFPRDLGDPLPDSTFAMISSTSS